MSWCKSLRSAFLLWILVPVFFSASYPVHARKTCSQLLEAGDSALEVLRNRLVSEYAKMAKETGEFPTFKQLQEASELTKSEIKTVFKNVDEVRALALERYPRIFRNVVDTELYNDQRYNLMMKELKKYKRFIITSAVPGSEVHEGFRKAIQKYCDEKNAVLIIVPQNNETTFLSPELVNEHVAFRDVPLNDHFGIKTVRVDAKRLPPSRLLKRFAQTKGSFVFASPRRFVEWVPVGNIKYPRVIMSTGAITKSQYGRNGTAVRVGDQDADSQHVVGAIVVENNSDGSYHFRHITAREDGSFVDLGRLFQPEGRSKRMNPEALVLGDWHSGETDPDVMRSTEEMTQALKPRVRVMHDVFNGLSINHHDMHKVITRANLHQEGRLSLAAELTQLADDLLDAAKQNQEVVIVKSNHDEFLDRWLESGAYMQDPANAHLAHELAGILLQRGDALRAGVKMFWKGTDKEWDRLRWLKRDEDYIISGVQLGAHGDLGANGGYPSMTTLATTYPKSVTGHNHTASILGNVWRVGTSSLLRLHYNRGPSSWTHTHAIVYEDGSVQLINIVNGKWRLDDDAE